MASLVESGSVDRARRYDDLICAVLRCETVAWPSADYGDEVEGFLARAEYHGVLPLIHHNLRNASHAAEWPEAIRECSRAHFLSRAASELAQRHEVRRLLAGLREVGVKPLLLKGGRTRLHGLFQSGASPHGRCRHPCGPWRTISGRGLPACAGIQPGGGVHGRRDLPGSFVDPSGSPRR